MQVDVRGAIDACPSLACTVTGSTPFGPATSTPPCAAGRGFDDLHHSWLTAAIPECHRRGDETPEMAAHLKCCETLQSVKGVD